MVELTGTAPVSSEPFALLHRYIVYIIPHNLPFVKDYFINSTEEEEKNMPVAEILAGIALVKSSVDFIKSNIDTCKDIGEIGSAIDGLLRGKDEVEKRANKRGLGIKEQFDTAHIAREAIDARLAAEQLQEISQMINLRFGPNTWREIMEERAKRIQEHKEALKQARIDKRKANEQLWSEVKQVLLVAGSIFAVLAIIVGSVWYSRL